MGPNEVEQFFRNPDCMVFKLHVTGLKYISESSEQFSFGQEQGEVIISRNGSEIKSIEFFTVKTEMLS